MLMSLDPLRTLLVSQSSRGGCQRVLFASTGIWRWCAAHLEHRRCCIIGTRVLLWTATAIGHVLQQDCAMRDEASSIVAMRLNSCTSRQQYVWCFARFGFRAMYVRNLDLYYIKDADFLQERSILFGLIEVLQRVNVSRAGGSPSVGEIQGKHERVVGLPCLVQKFLLHGL